jgi:hypothetical protein
VIRQSPVKGIVFYGNSLNIIYTHARALQIKVGLLDVNKPRRSDPETQQSKKYKEMVEDKP